MSGAMLAGSFYTMGYGQELARSMDKNQEDLLILTVPEYFSILQDKAKGNPKLEASFRETLASTSFGQYWQGTLNPNIGEPWVSPVALGAVDTIAISKTFAALGIAGLRSYVRVTATGTYIILKGFPARRSALLNGTRYLASTPAVMNLGLGMKGIKNLAKGGFILGVIVSSGIEVLDFLFNDQKTLGDLIGGIGVEATKAGIGALVGYGAAVAMATVTTVVVSPLVTIAVVAVAAGVALNYLDNRFEVKKRVIEALKMLPENATAGVYKINQASSSWFRDLNEAIRGKVEATQSSIGRQMMDWMCPVCRRF